MAKPTIRSVVDKPIKFIGTSEKMDGLDVFHPDRMRFGRILGMGDVISLVERFQQQFDEEELLNFQKKFLKTLLVLMISKKQIQQIKMGNMKDLMGMIPGMGEMIKEVDIDDDALKESIHNHSMTPHESANPMVNGSRKRIARW